MPSRLRRLRGIGAALVGAAVAVPVALSFTPADAATGHAAATPAPAVQRGHHFGYRYLALGDSVVFGYRPMTVTPIATYANPNNFVGYPEIFANNRSLHLTNASCPGETTGSFIDAKAQSNGCENPGPGSSNPGYHQVFPLHDNYPVSESQLQFAVAELKAHPNTKLVSLMIGANDLFVCEKTTTDGCASPTEQGALLQSISGNVSKILSTLRNTAHYTGDIALVNYYALNKASAGQTQLFDSVLSGIAKKYGGFTADAFGAFAKAEGTSGDPCASGLIIKQKDGTCDVHPTRKGQRLIAQALGAAVDANAKPWR